MQRRRLLGTIAAGGFVGGLTIFAANAETTPDGTSTDTARPRQVPVENLDALRVVRDGEVLRTVGNPTDESFRRLQESLGSGERIVDTQSACMTYCKEDCDVFCSDTECHYSHTCETDKYCCEATTSDSTATDTTST